MSSTFSPISGRSSRSMSWHDGVHVDDFQFQQLLAAEGEQLARQRGRAVGGLLNRASLVVQRMIESEGPRESLPHIR